MQVMELADVVTRLRLTDNRLDRKDVHLGSAAGITWAKREATAPQLRRLAKSFEEAGKDLERLFPIEHALNACYGMPWRLIKMLTFGSVGDLPDNRVGDPELWRRLGVDPATIDHKFAVAFIGGALAIWNEVRSQVDAKSPLA